MNGNKGEFLEELLRKRIRFLESEIAKIDVDQVGSIIKGGDGLTVTIIC